MKTLFLSVATTCLIAVMSLSNSVAQDKKVDEKLSMDVSLNQDAFFGFYPTLAGGYDLGNDMDFTFYGIQWGGGSGAAWGQWTEFGMGVNFTSGNLDINPQIGFTMGNLLSSGLGSKGVVGDGIVPNLTVGYDSDVLEGELYFGYYAALRDEAPDDGTTLNYVHYWLNAGAKVNSFISAGAHFEELFNSGGSDVDERTDYYKWIGPYVEFSKDNAGLRFSFGTDLTDEEESSSANEFYKLSFTFGF